jgi:hypothetical protein
MKKVFTIVTIVLLALTVNVFSQKTTADNSTKPKLTAQERTDKLVGEMTTQVTLTPEQVAKVTPIILQAFQQRDSDKITYENNPELLTSSRKQLIKDTSDKLKLVLSEGQMGGLKKYWNSRKAAFNK